MIFRKKDEEKGKIVIAVNFNTTPWSLLRSIAWITIALMFVAWGFAFASLFLYGVAYITLILILYHGLELRRMNMEYGNWIYVALILTLFFGTFAFSNNYVVFVVGSYLAGISGVLLPRWMIGKMMKDEEFREVFTYGYYGEPPKKVQDKGGREEEGSAEGS